MNISLGVRSSLMLFAAAWLFTTAGPACAQQAQAAGQFLSVTGDVRIVARDGAQRPAARAAQFYEGESIVTGSGALGQLRMADGTLMSVRPDTEMKLDRFSFAGEKDTNPSFLLSVVKGGFRTITGLIGKIKRESYRVATPAATLGIRGTDFELVHVQQQLATPTAPAGTYNRVYDGVTSFQNIAGATVLVSRDQTAFVALQGTAPPVLVAPPAAVFGRPTPPPSGPRSLRQDDGKTETAAPAVRDPVRAGPIDTATKIQTAPLLTPLDTAPTLLTAPLLTPIDTAPKTTTTIQTAPTTSTILTAPTTTTIQTAPTTTLTAPTTTLTAPTTTLIAPTTTTIQATPVLAPVTTTVTTVVKPVTTIVAPVLTPILK